jgi:hypothetical protein
MSDRTRSKQLPADEPQDGPTPNELPEPGSAEGVERVGSLASDAWRNLRRNPMFIVSAALILIFFSMAIVPGLFTRTDPLANELSFSRQSPSAQAWFGYDVQGRDIYARTVYGARASIVVGVLAALGTVLLGSVIGIIAGYYGRITDALLSRFGEIFLGLPFFLGAIVILTTFNPPGSNSSEVKIMLLVIVTLIALSWPISMRIMRSAVIAAKEAGSRCRDGSHRPAPPAAQHPGPGAGLRDPDRRRVHRRRGHAVLPGHRAHSAGDLLGGGDQRRPQLHPGLAPSAAVPGFLPDHYGACLRAAR